MHNGNGRHQEGTCIKVPFLCVIVAERLKVVTVFYKYASPYLKTLNDACKRTTSAKYKEY